MEAYHESMGEHFFSSITEDLWNRTAQYAAVAYREAQLRFPDNPRLDYWQMGEAVNMAVSSHPRSANLFQTLLLDALNNGRTAPIESDLSNWLAQYPSSFSIQFEEIPPPSAYTASYVIAISTFYEVGGVTFWVLEDEAGFTAQTLHENLGDPSSAYYGFSVKALTAPDASNIVINVGGHNGTFIYANHFIYDLSQPAPKRLDFGPYRPSLFSVRHGIDFETAEDGRDQLIIQVDHADWCSLFLSARYDWNGRWFEQVSAESQFWSSDTAEDCLLNWLAFSYFLASSELERAAILAHFESRYGDIRPTGEDLYGEPLEPDAQDEFRFYLALNHAVLEHVEQARNYLQRIIDTPSIEDSSWIEPAGIFLSVYDSAEKLYPACLQSALDICPHDEAFITSIANLPPMDWPALRSQIIEWGTAVAAGGSFDFDDDGEMEPWLALRHRPGDPLELWIFGRWDGGWAAVYADEISSLPPQFQFVTLDPARLHPNIASQPPAFDHTILSINNEEIIAFFRHPTTKEPFVRRIYYGSGSDPDPLGDRYDAILERLWAGEDTAEVVADLLDIAANPAFQPGAGYYYHLGLAYELMGDEDNAVAAYLRAWQDYCCDTWSFGPYGEPFTTANPYAIMAQVKLIPE